MCSCRFVLSMLIETHHQCISTVWFYYFFVEKKVYNRYHVQEKHFCWPMSFVFLQILEYYHEAFVPILKGLALFFFCLPNLHLLLALKGIQKKLPFSYEVVGIRSSCYCSMKLNVTSKERLCLLKFSEEFFFWSTPFL